MLLGVLCNMAGPHTKLANLNKRSYQIIDSNIDIKKNENLIINRINKLIK